MVKFIPITREQSDSIVDSALYNLPYGGIYAKDACEAKGYKLVKEIERVYSKDIPECTLAKGDVHDIWVVGWNCEVEEKK